MKKLTTVCLILAVLWIPLYAQEAAQGEQPAQEAAGETPAGQAAQPDPRAAAMAAMMKAEGIIRPGEVTTPMGKITLHGMVTGGVSAVLFDNSAVSKDEAGNAIPEDTWQVLPYDAMWTANMANVSITYDNGKYGGYILFQAADWDGSPEKNNKASVEYAFVWRSFFDNKLKFSLGKLYSSNMQSRERVWKTEGAKNGGWDFSDSRLYASFRTEYKPVDGLNVGFQWNMLPAGQSTFINNLPALEDSIKEIGLGVDYQNDLFSLTAGVKFDGADGMNKYDFYGYLDDYYGGWGYIGGSKQGDPDYTVDIPGGGSIPMPYATSMATRFKYRNEVYGAVDGNFTVANADKPFDGSHMAFFGFNFKGVKNLSAFAQAAFFNLGDFDRFGAGEIDETFRYQITPKFNAGLVMVQQFYGKDVFDDTIVNSPYFEFKPEVTYNLISNLDVYLRGTVGVCEDVVENLWGVRPGLTWTAGGFGSFRVEAFYELTSTTWTEKAAGNMPLTVSSGAVQGAPPTAGKPDYKHLIGLSAMWMF